MQHLDSRDEIFAHEFQRIQASTVPPMSCVENQTGLLKKSARLQYVVLACTAHGQFLGELLGF